MSHGPSRLFTPLPGRDLLQLHPGDGGEQRGAHSPRPQLPPPQPGHAQHAAVGGCTFTLFIHKSGGHLNKIYALWLDFGAFVVPFSIVATEGEAGGYMCF